MPSAVLNRFKPAPNIFTVMALESHLDVNLQQKSILTGCWDCLLLAQCIQRPVFITSSGSITAASHPCATSEARCASPVSHQSTTKASLHRTLEVTSFARMELLQANGKQECSGQNPQLVLSAGNTSTGNQNQCKVAGLTYAPYT